MKLSLGTKVAAGFVELWRVTLRSPKGQSYECPQLVTGAKVTTMTHQLPSGWTLRAEVEDIAEVA